MAEKKVKEIKQEQAGETITTDEVFVGVEPQDTTIEAKPKLTAKDVVEEIRAYILKHEAIAQGNDYNAQYINYKAFADDIIRKLNSFKV